MKDDVKKTVRNLLTTHLEENHGRKTPERFEILDAAYSIGHKFTLDELSEYLEANHFPVSRGTMYNTMRLLTDLRLVVCHRLGRVPAYEASYTSTGGCYQVCRLCGTANSITAPEVTAAIANAHLKRFHMESHVTYIYGICSSCLGRITRKNNAKKRNATKSAIRRNNDKKEQ